MKLVILALLVFATTVAAWEPDRTSAGYTSNTGTRYQYNTRNMGYRIRYHSDTAARIRDKTHGDKLVVQTDQAIGQHGAGIKFP